jgi:ferredoxin--NADP+ reductase
MVRVAVIGSGPGAMYTIKYLLKHTRTPLHHVDIFEKLKVPYGLVKFGVAPDHVEVKEVAKEFDELLKQETGRLRLRLFSPVENRGSLDELLKSYDATIVATGAQSAHRLRFPSLPKFTMSAQKFVYWYNGHPELKDIDLPESPRNVSVVGHGNVALDVTRMLSKSVEELLPLHKSGLLAPAAFEWFCARQQLSGPLSVSIIGRRGYMDAAFTNKEFRELTVMKDAVCRIDPSELDSDMDSLKAKSLGNRAKSRGIPIVQKCIETYKADPNVKNLINLRFFTKPIAYSGDPVASLSIETKSGSHESIPTDLSIESIGMKVSSAEMFDLPLDEHTGGIKHDGHGRVLGVPKLYVAGWSKRGPKGVIAANVPCCMDTADAIVEDLSKVG